MPILNVKVGAPRTPELSGRITEALLELTTRVLGKRRELTAVVITYVDPQDWYVAGRSLAELGQSRFIEKILLQKSFHFEIQSSHILLMKIRSFMAY